MPTPLLGSLVPRPLLAVALLAAMLLAVLPAATSAQTPAPPPKLFYGSNEGVTIDGQPWDGSTIEVINAAGDVVATVTREVDGWHVEVPNAARAVRFRATDGAVSEVYRTGDSSVTQVPRLVIGTPPGAGLTRAVGLEDGFNFIVWTGHTQAVDDALAGFPDLSALTAIFEYDTGGQRWRSFRPGLPAFVQGIAELQTGTAYFLLVGAAMTWDMPTTGDLTGTRTISTGFTAVGWAGPDATPQEVLDAIADPAGVTVFFRFNASTQGYDSYRPGLPAFIQGIRSIQPFDVLFVLSTSPTTITQ